MFKKGFTIVELLIVIIVIGILAAIVYVAYHGITDQAKISTIKSDLAQASRALATYKVNHFAFPADATDAGVVAGNEKTQTYVLGADGASYCLSESDGTNTYRFKSSVGQVEEGSCGATVSTLAGSGSGGFADGQGAAAQFNYPTGVAVDSSGNVYVADYNNNRIRKITPPGLVSTFAGSGTGGFADGQDTAAQFSGPYGVAVDSSGNVYVADYSDDRIRKITPSGLVSTLAGSGTAGFADGQGTAAQFSNPYGVAVDSSGNVYVADYSNNRIRKITLDGLVSTFAGSGTKGYLDGQGTAAQFNGPFGVAVDSSGNVYVTDSGNNRIRKITPSGLVSTLAGSGTAGFADGQGTTARFKNPYGVAVDSSGNVYVADYSNNRIRKITPSGLVSTLAGSGTAGFADGQGTVALFNGPLAVAVDASDNLYVADHGNNRIRKIEQ